MLFNLPSHIFLEKALEGIRSLKIVVKVIHTTKYADNIVLLVKEGNDAAVHQ